MADRHLLNDMISALEDYRSSMKFSEILGNGKAPFQKDLERIINQAKSARDVEFGIEYDGGG